MVEIRSFEPRDMDAVVELLKRTLTADPMTSEIFQRKVLLDPNFEPRGAPVAADENDEVRGFALGLTRKLPIEDQATDFDRAWLTLITVDPAWRRQGIGRKLLMNIEAYVVLRKEMG